MRAVAVDADVRLLTDMAELGAAADLLASIWGYPAGQGPATPELLRALAHSGNYVAGAWVGGALVGASAGWLGRRVDDDALHLHSHISGVVADRQGSHVGYALKQHQRAWALEHGLHTIEWTFDPLVRRNAYFNLAKLGAAVVGYEPDFYGPMQDAFNAGEETDRVVARWDLDAAAAAAVPDDGAVILRADGEGRPVAAAGRASVLKAWIPEDHVQLRRDDPALARGWRTALRQTVGAALQHSYVAVAMSRDGWYTLVRADR
jgi:predicted GNAT superfamily acetyltransferase